MSLPTPNYTQIPNYIIDQWMAKLSHGEFKVIMLILRYTTGFHRREASISYNHFEEKCGVSRTWVVKVCKKLEGLGWIQVIHGDKKTSNIYRILLQPQEKDASQLSTPQEQKVVNSVHHPSELSTPGVVNSVHPINKVRERKEKKNNVGTLLSSTDDEKKKPQPNTFIHKLTADQRKLHDQLIKYKPDWGEPLKSNDVCAWFLAKRYSIQQVQDAFKVYRQDADEARLKGRSVHSMGGAMVAAVKAKRIPKNAAFEANKKLAQKACAGIEGFEIKDQYIRFHIGDDSDVISYSLPMHTFSSLVENKKREVQEQLEYV